MTQVVYQDLPFAELEHHFADIMSAGYSVSLFTDWQNGRASEVWIKRRVDQGGASTPPPQLLQRPPRHHQAPPHPRPPRRSLHRPAQHRRPLVRAPPPLRTQLHSLQRPGTADRILRPLRPRLRSRPRRRNPARQDHAAPLHHRTPRHRRRRPLDEHGLPAPLARHPLHLEARARCRHGAPPADRSQAQALRRPPALGQSLRHERQPNSIPATPASRTSVLSPTTSTPTANSATPSSTTTFTPDP